MEAVKEAIKSGKSVYIYCPTGVARKIYHTWAENNGFSSIPKTREDFCDVHLFRCPDCGRKGYRSGCNYFFISDDSSHRTERSYPEILDEESLDTLYDDYNGRVYSYSVRCNYCPNKYDEPFVIVGEDDTMHDVNEDAISCYQPKIMQEVPNSILLCDYEQADDKLKKSLKSHRKKKRRRGKHDGTITISNKQYELSDLLEQLNDSRKFTIV